MSIENLMPKGELQPMRIGYARVSTRDQNLEMQLDALNKAGCKRIFTDKLSGAQVERPGLKEARSHLREADTLVVWKLDRLGRSVKGLVDLVNELETQKVHFQSITDGIDTKTPAGRFFFHVMASLAQMERELIMERTRAGLQAANPNKSQDRITTRIENVVEIRASLPDRLYSEISWLRGHFSQFCFFLGDGPNFCTLQRQSSCALEFASCEQHFPVGRA